MQRKIYCHCIEGIGTKAIHLFNLFIRRDLTAAGSMAFLAVASRVQTGNLQKRGSKGKTSETRYWIAASWIQP